MSADNGIYIIKTPALNGLGCEHRVGHAQAIENVEDIDATRRNEYLLSCFGHSWVFARERRAVALAYVIEEEFASWWGGYDTGTEYGVNVIPVDSVFPGSGDYYGTSGKLNFGDDDGVFVLKTPAAGGGFIWRVAYGQGVVESVAQLLSNSGRLNDLRISVDNLLWTFGRFNSMSFTSRGRAMRAAHLVNDDIVSRGGATAHGVVRLELPHEL
jgi:hypothetical protein